MAGVHADPQELINFANMLSQYINTLETETNNILSGFSNLRETWQDANSAAFEDQFSGLINQISQFKSSCEEQIPYLQKLASILEEYSNNC